MAASHPNHPCPPRPGQAQAPNIASCDQRTAEIVGVLLAVRDEVELSAKAFDLAEAVNGMVIVDPPSSIHRLVVALHWCIAALNGETDVPPPADFRATQE